MAARKGFVPVWKLCVTRVIPVGMATGAAMEFFMIKTGFCTCTTRMHNALFVLHTFLRLFFGGSCSLAAAVDWLLLLAAAPLLISLHSASHYYSNVHPLSPLDDTATRKEAERRAQAKAYRRYIDQQSTAAARAAAAAAAAATTAEATIKQ